MDVAITVLRAQLSEWLARAREGEDVVITDRGIPVARLVGIEAATTIERLTAAGVIGRPERSTRPAAASGARLRPRRPVSPRVGEQRA